jgi:protein-S-isoprenylcysteine O-methyltransferase Ste14
VKVTEKIHNFFDFHIFIFTVFFHLLLLFFVTIKSKGTVDIASFQGQIGTIIIFIGLLLRIFAADTKRYLNTIKVTGIYTVCRQPMLVADAIMLIGFNIIANRILFTLLSSVFFIIFEVNYFWQYDKILQHSFKDVYKIYSKYVSFIIPTIPKIKDFRMYKINLQNITSNNYNRIIFTLLYLFLILASFLHKLNN